MAKKKTSEETSVPAVPARRRAPARKQAAATLTPTPTQAPGNGGAGNGAPEPTRAEIAEAAYFRHLNRGGRHGDEFTDWIEAERELKERHTRVR